MAKNFKITITALDKTKKGFATAARGIKAVAGSVLSLKTAIVGAVGVGGIGLLIKSSLDATDSLAKTARKIGATTEALAAMRYAASLTGVATATMDMALQRFTRRVAEAAVGTGEAKGALKELNLNARQLVKLPLDKQMQELAGAFEEVETDADKVRLAMKLFDSEGVALVNTLGIGKDALVELAAEADKLGVALSGDAAKGVEDANDAFTRLATLFKGIRDQAVAALAPALESLATTLQTKLLTAINETDGGVEAFAKNMAIKVLESVQTVLSALQSLVNGVITTINDMNIAVAKFTGIFKDNENRNAVQLAARLETVNELLEERNKKAANPRAQQAHDRAMKALEDEKAQIEKLMLAKKNAGETSLIPEVAFADDINATLDGFKAKINEVNQARNGESEDGSDENSDPVKKEENKYKALRDLFDHHKDLLAQGETEFTNFKKKNAVDQTKSVLAGLSEQLKGTGLISKKMGNLEKAVAIKKALIATYESSVKAFAAAGGFPMGIPAAAISIAQGMAQVAAIKAQSFEGGGFTGHGSRSGGLDGKGGFPAILHPNETVIDNTKSSSIGRSGSKETVIVNQTINVTTGVQGTVRAEISNLMPQIAEAAQNAVLGARMRGGQYSKQLIGR